MIFDEPTAVLTPQEANELFKIMRSLTDQGKSIIFITHKLQEVLDVSDKITVIRNGKVIGTTKPEDANQAMLASMMVGREVMLEVDKKPPKTGDVILRVDKLLVADDIDQVAVDNIDFEVKAGEILGIAGVQGNGQTELVESLTGLREILNGKVELLGEDLTNATPREITEMGTAHVPEDRQRDGLVLPFPVKDNLVLCSYYQKPFAKGLNIQWQNIWENAHKLIEDYDIRTPSELTPAGSLSGGNQQKVIVARELSRPIKLLIAAQPTRGLDVGSIEYIHQQIIKRRDEGVAVLLVSTELDEIMQLSDRIAVMFQGQIVAVVSSKEATKEYIGLLMAGVPEEQAKEQIQMNSNRILE